MGIEHDQHWQARKIKNKYGYTIDIIVSTVRVRVRFRYYIIYGYTSAYVKVTNAKNISGSRFLVACTRCFVNIINLNCNRELNILRSSGNAAVEQVQLHLSVTVIAMAIV